MEDEDVTSLLSVDESEAYILACNTIKEIGLEDFVCVGQHGTIYRDGGPHGPLQAVYDFIFTRQFHGVDLTYTNDDTSSSDEYAKPWQYEKVHVLIDDGGVFSVRYQGPIEIAEILLDATQLLPFSEIQRTFEKMVLIVDNMADTGIWGATTQEYVIMDIRLGLMSVQEADSDTGLLLPVWDFMGYSRFHEAPSGRISELETNGYQSFLTINAIDGSVISRSRGY